MYIKQITIQGFKSYKNQTVVDPFSPKLNVVVGRNGSGKSNFFAAIRFVLNDDYQNMDREHRQALLHEGHGSAIMSAYVELVFTQCGQRFQTNDDELILRRTIGMKKDEYTVNRKNTTKGEVMQMLETAGFSRQNPYYIVPQGRITRLTNMKDSERLGLLKSVAGTQHFTAKKEESMKILNDTNNKLTAIDDIFKQINDRMSDLEEEQQELREFQEADKERKGLEWALYSREQNEIQHSLDSIDQNRDRGIDGADEGRAKFDEGEDALQEILEHIQTLKQEISTARIEKKQYEDERRDKAKERAQVDLDVRNMRDSRDASQNARAARSTDIKSLKAQIKQAEQDLAKITPKFDAESKKEKAVKARLDEDEATQQRLYGKQGRNARFKSKAERDAWLQKQIDESFEAYSSFRSTKLTTTENIAAIENDIEKAENDIKQMKTQIDEGGNTFEKQIQTKIQERDNLMDERKRLWRTDASLESTLSASREKLRQHERALSHMMDHNTSKGLDAVRRIKRQHNLTGCFGTLAELITVPEHHTAVEAVAGNSIFHYVVDTDETASKCMEILNRERAGRITFMPLNRLHPKAVNFPQAQDARPLTELIQFDRKYEKAVNQVFGRAIVAQNLSVASQYARTHGLTAVTPEGDRSDKKGALTGGYHDQRHSRLKTVQIVNAARAEFEAAEEELRTTRDNIERLSQRITNAVGEVQKLEREQKKTEGNVKQFRQDIASKTELLGRLKNDLESKNKQAETIAARMNELEQQQTVFGAEKNSEFKKALTQAEEAQLEKATTSVQKLRQEYNQLASARAEVEAQKLEIELRLNSSLRPRLAALEAYEDDEGSPSTTLQSREREMERLNADFDSIVQQLKQLEDSIETKSTQVAELEAQAAETRRAQEELQKSIDKAQRRLEKAVQKRATLIAARQDVAENIRDLGAVPEEMKAKYKRTESDKIVKRLQKVKDSLKKYTSVNKHAYEHYRKSQKAREELEQRREELNKGKESIQRLIESLDQRKDEAIERTFKQVSKAFSEVFKKLVPAGYGRLKIIRDRDVRENEDESEDERPRNKKGIENYRGVDISVSFNSKHDDQQRIQQLSGGQKSLCSLALIFAIQATDPAPFYIFDEIDANLDAQYRTAVAEHLHYLAEKGNEESEDGEEDPSGGQFICTTFRPEMLRVAEKCYGVTFANNVSAIRVESMENALDFVESQTQ
ncbi:Chromosome segregation protein sudA [Cyphellophora attinorum]|uniref:Structural maintenance of chromosomes protein n=1 Tax=Cyphellophora attinorum TaxID=1664694 RepID=A0A0N1HGE7_9EURO|nr:Chromosome segregation protein sudA [Phialophora attinorum]KPI34472.1 Chromosome segregation protein sudA [Phialophora attinorum]